MEENRFGINRGVLQTWAEQNQTDFLNLSHEYLIGLSKSPSYQQPLSDFTDVIHCLLLRFQPEKAMKFYQQWSAESVRTIFFKRIWNRNPSCSTLESGAMQLTKTCST